MAAFMLLHAEPELFLFQLMSLKTLTDGIFLFWELTPGWKYHHQWTDPNYEDYQWLLIRKLLISCWNVILHSELLGNKFEKVGTICCFFCYGCSLPYLMARRAKRRENKPNGIFLLLPMADPDLWKSNKNDFVWGAANQCYCMYLKTYCSIS